MHVIISRPIDLLWNAIKQGMKVNQPYRCFLQFTLLNASEYVQMATEL